MAQADAVLSDYGESQIDALKRAVLGASLFALVALWLAGDMPAVPLSGPEPAPGTRQPKAEPVPET